MFIALIAKVGRLLCLPCTIWSNSWSR